MRRTSAHAQCRLLHLASEISKNGCHPRSRGVRCSILNGGDWRATQYIQYSSANPQLPHSGWPRPLFRARQQDLDQSIARLILVKRTLEGHEVHVCEAGQSKRPDQISPSPRRPIAPTTHTAVSLCETSSPTYCFYQDSLIKTGTPNHAFR